METFKSFAAKGTAAVRSAASTAMRDARTTAALVAGGSSALQLVGSVVTLAGRSFLVEGLLAEGGFGSVYTVSLVTEGAGGPGGAPVAAARGPKFVLKKMFAGSPELAKQLSAEVTLMQKLQGHANIVKVLAADSKRMGEGAEISVMMELCPGGHLLTRLNSLKESKTILPWSKILEVFLQIVRAVGHMHAFTPPTTHRDLKFENVLIAADGSLKLCDFGSASTHAGPCADKADRAEQEDAILRYTTPHFRAPEMCDLYNNCALDVRSDVWALGCMLYGLAYFSHPFQEAGNLGIMAARYKLPTSPPFPPPIHTLIRACLSYRPEDRPTAAAIVAYGEQCLASAAAAGGVVAGLTFPRLELSGGGFIDSKAIATPVQQGSGSPSHLEEGVLAAYPDGSVMVSGLPKDSIVGGGSGRASGSGGAHQHPPANAQSARDSILSQVQTAASSGSRSSALASRLAKKGGAPAPTSAAHLSVPAFAPAVSPPIHRPGNSSMSSNGSSAGGGGGGGGGVGPSIGSDAGDDLDENFAALSFSSAPTAGAAAAAVEEEADVAQWGSAGGGADDSWGEGFAALGAEGAAAAVEEDEVDFFSGGGGGSGGSGARVRAPSGEESAPPPPMPAAPLRRPAAAAPAPVAAIPTGETTLDDFFSSSSDATRLGGGHSSAGSATAGMEDLFSFK